jgi:hypothetical protein
MRTKKKPSDFESGDWIEKTCSFLNCNSPIFFTTNVLAEYCSDKHRYKGNQLKHRPKNELLRAWNKQFKKNSIALKRLYTLGIKQPTSKELKIAGFDYSVRDKELKTVNQNPAFNYFDHYIVIKDDNTYEIGVNAKK